MKAYSEAIMGMDSAAITNSALSSLSLDRETGELRLLNTVPTFGADPCYVATNGREVLTANYSGGTMSVFPLQKDGTLAPADTLFPSGMAGFIVIQLILKLLFHLAVRTFRRQHVRLLCRICPYDESV